MKVIRSLLRARSLASSLLELSGMTAIVYGVSVVYRPAGYMVGGLLAVVVALALDRRPKA